MPGSKTANLSLVSMIVSRYVAHNTITPDELARLITTVHQSLAEIGRPVEGSAPRPAIAINRSYGRDDGVCLECGWGGQVLRRHFGTAHELSTDDYRTRWNLNDIHPLVAPAYTERRSIMAKQIGLGHHRTSTAISAR